MKLSLSDVNAFLACCCCFGFVVTVSAAHVPTRTRLGTPTTATHRLTMYLGSPLMAGLTHLKNIIQACASNKSCFLDESVDRSRIRNADNRRRAPSSLCRHAWKVRTHCSPLILLFVFKHSHLLPHLTFQRGSKRISASNCGRHLSQNQQDSGGTAVERYFVVGCSPARHGSYLRL